jgi:hypothetical protein
MGEFIMLENSNMLVIAMTVISSIAIIVAILSIVLSVRTKKRYERYVKKLGDGDDIALALQQYIKDVEEVKLRNNEIVEYCNSINHELRKSITKVGLVRYDTYSNTRNKLSFAIALLNRNNDGILLNSIYGEDSSNIFAKPVIKGDSIYPLSSEERDAISMAINRDS